jgi:hypothetical protein
MPIQVTTDLPDEDQPVLGNGVEDEVAVDRETSVSNYGDVRIQIRETGQSSWDSNATGFGEFIGSYDTRTMEFVGREDGEEYEVRARTETEHRTGAWTDPVSIVTEFPGVTNLSVTATSQTSVDLSGEDNADNEDGFRLHRQREYDYGWGPWQEVADLPANFGTGTITPTDDTASPGNTYRYKMEAYTEHATGESNTTDAATTDSSGRPRTRTDAQGWTVHVHHPNADSPIEPRLLDDPSLTPALNDYPRVEIPVPRDEKWQADAFEDARLSVWKDGQIQPIDQLVTVRMEADRTILEGRGGRELDDRVQAQFDDVEAHVAADQLGTENTSYLMNVDDPASKTQSDTVMQSGESESELRDALASPIADDEPVEVTADGQLHLQQSCFVREAENPDRETDPGYISNDDSLSGGEGRGVYSGSSDLQYDITVLYRIPSEDVGFRAKVVAFDNAQEMEIRLHVDGAWYQLDYLSGGEGGTAGWREFGQSGGYNGSGYSGPDIPAGSTVTVQLRSTGSSGGSYDWDCLALYDTGSRFTGFTYTWDETNDGNGGYLDGPEEKPDAYDVLFADILTAFNVTAGKIDVQIDDTSGEQTLDLSNDGGSTWAGPEPNTSLFETSFGSAGSSIRWKVTLSRYGSRTDATPKTGIYGQSVDAFTLFADLEDTPVLDAQTYDGQLKDVFNQIAEYGNFIWSLDRDQSGWRVEWTQPGQRTSDVDDDLADYRVEKSTEQRYEKAVIKGGNQPVQGEEFAAQHDTWVALDQSELVSGREIVRDPDTGKRFKLGTDYELDRSEGRIKALSGGSMSDATVYEIDYEFKPTGSYTAADAGSNPDTVVRTRPELASNRACEQAALYLIQRVQKPQWSAEVTVPQMAAGISLVDDITWANLPTRGERMEVQDIEQSPQQTVLHLGNWEGPGQVLDDFASRISANSERS